MAEAETRIAVEGFRHGLVCACREGACGTLEAYSGGEGVGSVVLAQGRVAWAVCRYQPEHLGGFLRRLGQISAEQLEEASVAYRARAGSVKLGRILEESGLVSRPVLRRCLLLHVRMALACLLRDPAVVGQWQDGGEPGEQELSFDLRELFPELVSADAMAPPLTDEGDLEHVLAELRTIPGYRCSVIADGQGAPMAVHSDAKPAVADAPILATSAVTLAEGASATAGPCGLGVPQDVILEGSDGAMAVKWLPGSCEALVAVFLSRDGRTGVARHKLATCASRAAMILDRNKE